MRRDMFVSPPQEVGIIATSWAICSSCSAWSAGWCTAAFPVSTKPPPTFLNFTRSFSPLTIPLFSFSFFLPPPSDWRIHCATTYAKDGFWLYLTQIASCSPWMFWMFLNSVFHFMWVAVLIMCQLYQVRVSIWCAAFETANIIKDVWTSVGIHGIFLWSLSQIAALGITTNERMNARRYKHFKVTATSIESPFK